jgi:hypothetical protein
MELWAQSIVPILCPMGTGTENTKHPGFAVILIVKSTNLCHEQKWRDWYYPTSTVHCDTHFNWNGTCGLAGHWPAKCPYWSYHSWKTYIISSLRAHQIIRLAFSTFSAQQDQTIDTFTWQCYRKYDEEINGRQIHYYNAPSAHGSLWINIVPYQVWHIWLLWILFPKLSYTKLKVRKR